MRGYGEAGKNSEPKLALGDCSSLTWDRRYCLLTGGNFGLGTLEGEVGAHRWKYVDHCGGRIFNIQLKDKRLGPVAMFI